MKFKARGLVTLQPHVEAFFEPLDATFQIAPATSEKYQAAVSKRVKAQDIQGAATKVMLSATVAASRFSPKNPPPGCREHFGLVDGARPSRAQIQEYLMEARLSKLEIAQPDDEGEDVLLLVLDAFGLKSASGEDLAWSPDLGRDILGEQDRVSSEVVARVLKEENARSMTLGDLWRAWVFMLAQDEDLFLEAQSPSPNA